MPTLGIVSPGHFSNELGTGGGELTRCRLRIRLQVLSFASTRRAVSRKETLVFPLQ